MTVKVYGERSGLAYDRKNKNSWEWNESLKKTVIGVVLFFVLKILLEGKYIKE